MPKNYDADKYHRGIRHASEPLGEWGYVLTDPFDPWDVWGSVMGSAFMINDVLTTVGGDTSETYRQGAGGPDEDAIGYSELTFAVDNEELDVEKIEETRDRLDKLIEQAEADDLSY